MKKIKYIYEMVNTYWNLKPMLKSLFLITVIFTLVSFLMNDPFLLILIAAIWLTPLVIISHSWFAVIKPTIKEVDKEIKIEDKYSFMLRKFNKR